jgi:cancer susceptibility candidate protein 1
MKCNGTPDPTVLPEINTFISLWLDENQQNLDIDHTIKQTDLVLSLIDELHYVIHAIPSDSLESNRISTYRKVN